METNLTEYGIQNENSICRAHVCPLAKVVYTYNTRLAVEHIQAHSYPVKPAYQDVNGIRILTAKGYIVPVVDIPMIRKNTIWDDVWETYPIQKHQTTSHKGQQALLIVQTGLRLGLIALPTLGDEIDDLDNQIQGRDIVVHRGVSIQVKCDFLGGERHLHPLCTGNLYLQIAERNPHQYH